MKKFQKAIICLFAMMSLFLVGCSGKSENNKNENENKKTELVIAQEGEPKSLDVHNGNDGYSLKINKLIYSRLVEVDGDMNIIPGLAESWKNLDDKTVQFKIRKGVKFHNGDNLTMEDIKFSFERMMQSPRISFVLPPIEKIDIIDDNTINIVTKQSFGPLLAHLSHPALGIVSEKLVKENEHSYTDHPIGTGAYKFKAWKAGETVTLERNDEYFFKPGSFKTIVFKNVVEGSARTIGLETKEYDIALGIQAIDEQTIKSNNHLKLLTKPSSSFSYIGMNNEKGPFKDIRVRKAINYAIDKQSIIDAVLLGTGKIATSPIGSAVFGFTDKTKAYEFDLLKAKELMKEAGYENGFKTSIYVMGGESDKQTAEIVQANLKEIGIDLTINVVESSAYWDLTSKGNHEMFLGSWGCVTGDADYGLYSLYHSKAKGAPGNRDFYSNPVIDSLLDEARESVNQEKRKELYEKIQIELVNDAPDIMLFYRVLAVGTQKNIEGLNLHPVTLHDFYPVYIKDEK